MTRRQVRPTRRDRLAEGQEPEQFQLVLYRENGRFVKCLTIRPSRYACRKAWRDNFSGQYDSAYFAQVRPFHDDAWQDSASADENSAKLLPQWSS